MEIALKLCNFVRGELSIFRILNNVRKREYVEAGKVEEIGNYDELQNIAAVRMLFLSSNSLRLNRCVKN